MQVTKQGETSLLYDWQELPPKGIKKMVFYQDGLDFEWFNAFLVRVGRRTKNGKTMQFLRFGQVWPSLLGTAVLQWKTRKGQFLINMETMGCYHTDILTPLLLPAVATLSEEQLPATIIWRKPKPYSLKVRRQLFISVNFYGKLRKPAFAAKEQTCR